MKAELIWSDLLAYSLQVGLLVGIGAAIPALFRIRAPRARLLFWQILLAACIALPWVRGWKQEVVASAVHQVLFLANAGTAGGAPLAPRTIPFTAIALWAIGAGIAIRLGNLAVGLARLRAYRRRGQLLESEFRIPGIPRHVEIMISNDVPGPVTFGWREPAILLPARFPSLSAAMREAILCHELVHVDRRDWLSTLAEELFRAVLWFHPAVWWVIGEIHLAREQAVDESVLETTQAREPYMDALLTMAGVATAPHADLAPAPMFLRKRHLKKRLVAIVKEVRMKRVSGTRLACVTAAAMMTVLAAGWMVTGIFPLAAAPRYANDGAGVTVNTASSHLLHRAPVRYPEEARAKGIEGTIVAQLRLNADGEVADAAILSGPQELRKAVLESVLAWHFEKAGTESPQTISVQFAKPAILAQAPPTQPAQSVPTQPTVATTKIRHIIINNLPDEVRDSLRSTLPVHEGDDWSPTALSAVNQTARSFDSHLRSTVQRDAQGQSDIVIGLPATMEVAAAPQNPDESDVMHVGNGVSAPELISKTEPEYSEEARAAKFGGSVLLRIVIGTDGRAADFEVIKSLGMGLDESAIAAVQQWRFRPGMKAGVPVKVQAQIEVNFRNL
ncbi:MAG TPA: M56 family metallopeptidase [Bryobacteraceae bacterium]|jgi:TonB family protein